MVKEPDPESGAFQWSWRTARRHRQSWVVGAVLFAILTAVAYVLTPTTWGTTFELGLISTGMAALALVILSVLYALLLAPLAQRNALKDLLEQERSDHSAIQSKIAATPVSLPHRDRLRGVLAAIDNSAANRITCDLDNPSQSALAAHYPNLMVDLVAWNVAIRTRDAKAQAFSQRFSEACSERGIARPVFNPDQLLPQLLRFLLDRADQGNGGATISLAWHHWGDEKTGFTSIGGADSVFSWPEAHKEGLNHWACMLTIELLLRDAETWPETQALNGRDDALLELADPLMERSRMILERDVFSIASECPICLS